MRRVLVLRPEPGASATVERARERGLDAVSVPLFEIEPVDWRMPATAGFDGLLITSANALRAAGDRPEELLNLKVYAVGAATAERARDAGFDVAATGEGGAEQLLGSIDPNLKLLHLCGEDRPEPRDARHEITALTVYRSRPIGDPDLSIAGGTVALIHSAGAARRLAELVQDRGSVAIVSISAAAADAVGSGWESLAVAEQPTDDALLVLAASLCNKPDPK
jgi:uroporphyrinogen-III synthase